LYQFMAPGKEGLELRTGRAARLWKAEPANGGWGEPIELHRIGGGSEQEN